MYNDYPVPELPPSQLHFNGNINGDAFQGLVKPYHIVWYKSEPAPGGPNTRPLLKVNCGLTNGDILEGFFDRINFEAAV